ncbi:carotenoid oxygenase family protein [Mycolicibacterium thermoresistibile]|jgi:all-trans-8'-apo-beta-carotenal 15,15'-oxygenase|uniref:Dioxygenase n=1 Tax=Mycolicibacterium thermoresistibile TaxID=1797 RepID=A0A100XBN5_MYCTH|nr:carotenoid oxygenase family protein [Mycolicibacterium thermoresistibile]MCV7187680.1 carotenoid oxygenase family protein [Mycolicibacterium thermoresistibile]GAT13578.1 carotenoid oxygenase [Mycolicibacterium thermoresistibile]SNW17219.1 carotenoid oxygenase [Mycolicibacterium thermoresistibile]
MSPEPVGSRQQDFSGFTPLHEEYDYLLDEVAGAVPEQLRGTVYRNGPGRLEAGGQPLGHLFDGDGMLSMFRFADGRVRFRNRYVRTRHYRRSRHTRGAPFRGLGTMRPGGVLANALRFPVNVANTAVIMHAGTLLALWEAGRPTEIDPDSLDTVGEYDYDGELRWLGAFSAHPKWDPDTGEMFNFGLALAPIPKLVCYRVDPTGRLTTLGAVRLSAPMFNHDVGLTKRHMVFVVPPLVFRPSKLAGAALGLHDYIDALEYDAERPTMIALVPRDGGRVRIVHTEPLMHLHIANAYDDGADTVVELLNYDASWTQLNAQLLTVDGTVPDTTMPYGGVLRRIRITRSGRVIHEPLTDLRGDFPMLNPRVSGRRHRYTYLVVGVEGSTYPNAVAKLDHHTGASTLHRLPPGHLAHEPVFIPRPGGAAEDDGWLAVVVQDCHRHRAHLRLLDAGAVSADPVFTGHLRHSMPLTFHGCFTPRVGRSG